MLSRLQPNSMDMKKNSTTQITVPTEPPSAKFAPVKIPNATKNTDIDSLNNEQIDDQRIQLNSIEIGKLGLSMDTGVSGRTIRTIVNGDGMKNITMGVHSVERPFSLESFEHSLQAPPLNRGKGSAFIDPTINSDDQSQIQINPTPSGKPINVTSLKVDIGIKRHEFPTHPKYHGTHRPVGKATQFQT